MKNLLSVIVAASLLLYPFAAFAEDYGSQIPETVQVPPVAQTLVREGDFAIKLAATLNLGSPTDEASAEEMLAKAGVVPQNGWLSDYPVTPEIIGQLRDSIDRAASEGKLPTTAEEANKGLYALAAQMNLPAPAGPQTPPQDNTVAPPIPPDAQMVEQYYYYQGPPAITYYPPPVYYGYLYDWVPYPTFWFGFWFPGYYVCHSFTRVVVVNRGPVIVSNHVIDRHTRTVATVDPVTRTTTGAVRPETTLRSQDGRTFRNLADLRNGVSLTTERSGISANRALEGSWSQEARRSAGTIYSRSLERMRTGMVPEGTMARGGTRQFVVPRAPGRSYSGPFRGGTRRFIAPGAPQRMSRPFTMRGSNTIVRPFVSSRASLMRGEGRPSGVSASSRTYAGGGRYSSGSFTGNGWHGR